MHTPKKGKTDRGALGDQQLTDDDDPVPDTPGFEYICRDGDGDETGDSAAALHRLCRRLVHEGQVRHAAARGAGGRELRVACSDEQARDWDVG